jgi:protein-disulfide isomerase
VLDQNQIINGDVLYIYYDYPLNIHPQAEVSANAARCAGEQSAVSYWDMHDMLFARPREWSNGNANATFIQFADEMGLNVDEFTACVEEGRYNEQIQADFEYGISKGVTSTPYFFVNDQPLVGAQPLEVFNQAIATVMEGGELANAQPEAPPQPTPVVVADEGIAAVLGSDEAPYTIVEFTDYGCENCARHAIETLPKVNEFLAAPGQVRYLLKDLPGDSGNPEVQGAAIAARCAGEQDAYWEMHESLFSTQTAWLGATDAEDTFIDLASDLALDADAFAECVTSGKFDSDLQSNLSEAGGMAIEGYPHFIIEGTPLNTTEPNALALALGLPMDVPIETGAFTLGDPNAPITIIEYTDYQCPFCTRHFEETWPQLKENFVDTGDVYYIMKDFPLTSIHPQAVKAAEAARCAGEQDAYLEMHDVLFAQQTEWSGNPTAENIFFGYANDLNLDVEAFMDCLSSGKMETAVIDNMNEGMSFGVNGTPAFFINGILVSGALPYESFEQGLNGMLADLE